VDKGSVGAGFDDRPVLDGEDLVDLGQEVESVGNELFRGKA
jgi:hypothetical protein